MKNDAASASTGAAGAALLSSAIGAFALGVCALAGDAFASVARALNFWNPTGPLSGVTAVAIAVWLLSWLILSRRWANRDLDLRQLNRLVVVLYVAGLLLTFPPFMDLLQGK